MLLHKGLSGLTISLLLLTLAGLPSTGSENATTLSGTVESNGTGLAGYEVSLYARFLGIAEGASVLGRTTTGRAGEFKIDYHVPRGLPSSQQPLLFVYAKRARPC